MKEDGQALSVASRAGLLAGIRRRRPEFEAAGERAEKLRTLPGETVATLRAMGAFWLKTPAERVRQQLFRNHRRKSVRPARNRLPQRHRTVHL